MSTMVRSTSITAGTTVAQTCRAEAASANDSNVPPTDTGLRLVLLNLLSNAI